MASRKTLIYRFLIILFLLLGVFLRIDAADTSREIILGDETTYHYAAENLLKYGTLTYDVNGDKYNGKQQLEPSSNLSIGYPIYIAIIYSIFNHSTQAVLISQVILSMVCLWLIYKMLSMLNIRKPYITIALLFAAVYPGFLYNIDRMLTEQLFSTLLLAFVFYFLRAMQKNSLYLMGLSATFFCFATHVRALAFPFLVVVIFFLVVYEHREQMLKKVGVFAGVVLLLMLPWWIRNWLSFDAFILLSEGGEGPKIWGAVPYFIDMASANKPLSIVLQNNISPNTLVYYKWRIFGFVQYMWGDLWDERLVHPNKFLRPFIVIQQLIIVPCIIAIPFLIRKCRKEVIFISCIPIGFTLMNMPFHGLPRYVYPSIPFVFILLGVLIQMLVDGARRTKEKPMVEPLLSIWQRFADRWVRRSYIALSAVFSIVLFYSVYVFAYGINGEMSEYRLSRYMGVTPKTLQTTESVSTRKYEETNITTENATIYGGKYKNDVDAPAIIKVEDSLIDGVNHNEIVSEIVINIQGGYLFDYMTVYWTGGKTTEFNENNVYKFPINPAQQTHKIYVDDDVKSLMIVPAVFRGGSFKMDSIEIKKYQVE